MTHCRRGHEFTPGNTYIKPLSGRRQCITCMRAYSKTYNHDYYLANREILLEYRKQYNAVNKEKRKAYREANRDSENKKSKARREANKEDYRKKRQEKHAENPEKRRSIQAEWREKNPDKVREIRRRYTKNNRDKVYIKNQNRRALKKHNGGKLSKDITSRLLSLQKGKCSICKKSLHNSGFHIDHIIPLSRGGKNIDANVQLACPNCNHMKGGKDPIKFMQERGYLL